MEQVMASQVQTLLYFNTVQILPKSNKSIKGQMWY